jgi:hypothetical protein
MFLDLMNYFWYTNMVIYVLETVPRKEDSNWRKVGKGQPTPARAWHTGMCPVVHQTMSGAPG